MVREGEFATAEQTAGLPQQVVSMYNKLLSGERLTPEQRQNFIDQAGTYFNQSLDRYNQYAQDYSRRAKQARIDPTHVIPSFKYEPYSPKGAQGAQGYAGKQGAQGYGGRPGAQGAQGAQGQGRQLTPAERQELQYLRELKRKRATDRQLAPRMMQGRG